MEIKVEGYVPHIDEWLEGGGCEAEGCKRSPYYKVTSSGSDDDLYNRTLMVCKQHKDYLLRVLPRQAKKEGKEATILVGESK